MPATDDPLGFAAAERRLKEVFDAQEVTIAEAMTSHIPLVTETKEEKRERLYRTYPHLRPRKKRK